MSKQRLPLVPYTDVDRSVLPPRISIAGYIKIGGVEEDGSGKPVIRVAKSGRPWVRPTSWTKPVRFAITTREKRVVEWTARNGDKHEVEAGYERDEVYHGMIAEQHPKELRVTTLFARPEDNYNLFLGAYGTDRWICKGDGTEALDVETGPRPCMCPRHDWYSGDYHGPAFGREGRKAKCKLHFHCWFALDQYNRFGLLHSLKTTSGESAANIRTQLEMVYEMTGNLTGIPWILKVMPATKRYVDATGSHRTTQPIVTLALDGSVDEARAKIREAADRTQALLTPGVVEEAKAALQPALEREAEEEERSYQAEYLPGEPVEPQNGPETPDKVMEALDALEADEGSEEPEEEPGGDLKDLIDRVERGMVMAAELSVLSMQESTYMEGLINARDEGGLRAALDLLRTKVREARAKLQGEDDE